MNHTMRHALLATSVLLTAFTVPVFAQDVPPRVLFCSGPCFSVDASGARAPVSKGTELRPGQRLETGPGAYLQVKLGRVGLGLAENTRVRFEPGTIALDQGRMRAVTGMGAILPGVVARPPQFRTPDGDLTLAGGDIEIKRSAAPGTLVKLNAGAATLRSGAGEFKLPTEGIQSIQGGRLSLAPPTVAREMVLTPLRRDTPAPGAPTLSTPTVTPTVRPVLTESFAAVRAPTIIPPPPAIPTLVSRVVNTTLTDTATGTTAKLATFVNAPPPPAPTTLTLTTTRLPVTTTTTTLTPTTTRTTFVIR